VEYKDELNEVVVELRKPSKASDSDDNGGMFWEMGGGADDWDDDWDVDLSAAAEDDAEASPFAVYEPGAKLDPESLVRKASATLHCRSKH